MTTLTRGTQKESLMKALKDNMISQRQKYVLEVLTHHLPNGGTAREISVAMFNLGFTYSPERNTSQPRLTELVNLGLVKVSDFKVWDSLTNRGVAHYTLDERFKKEVLLDERSKCSNAN